jgi:hypothetical protein
MKGYGGVKCHGAAKKVGLKLLLTVSDSSKNILRNNSQM